MRAAGSGGCTTCNSLQVAMVDATAPTAVRLLTTKMKVMRWPQRLVLVWVASVEVRAE